MISVQGCSACSLREGCNQVVPGAGPEHAKLLIINDFPGVDEDIIGEPLVGLSGKYLDKILKLAGISREEVYITHIVKCKPPAALLPAKEHIDTCKKWLWEEMKMIRPKVIVTLGKLPLNLLMKKKNIIIRDFVGKSYNLDYIDAILMPWYNPDYLLQRGKSWETDSVEFFKKVKERL